MIHPSHRIEARTHLIAVAVLGILFILALLLPAPTAARGLANYLPLHTALEVAAISAAVLIFAIGWNTHRHLQSSPVLWLACLFMGVALLDLTHTLSYSGMPPFVTPSGTEKAINFWLAARSLAVIALLAIAFGPPTHGPTRRWTALLAVMSFVIALHLLFLYRADLVPSTFIPGTGLTRFKISFEYALIALCLVAAIRLGLQLTRPRRAHASGLFAAAITMAMSELFFTLYADVTDAYNLLGHLYKVAAYAFLYRALFVETVQRPYVELAASQQQLAATLDALPDLLFEMSEDGCYLNVHASRSEALIAPIEDLVGRRVQELMPPAAATTCLTALQDARLVGRSHGRRITLPIEGAQRHFELSVARMEPGNNSPTRYLVLSRDITRIVEQEHELEHEARLNEALLKLTQESAHMSEQALLVQAADHAMRLTDSRCAALYLVSEDGRELHLSTPAQPEPACPIALSGPLEQALRARSPVQINAHAFGALPESLRSGCRPQQRMVAAPARDDRRTRLLLCLCDKATPYTGRDLQTLEVLTDAIWQTVHRRRQEGTILRLSSAVSQNPYPVMITAPDTRIEYVNPAFCALTGYAAEEAIGMTPALLNSGKTPGSTYTELWAHLARGDAWQGEFINRRKDGSEFTESALIYPVRNSEGQTLHYIAHKEDITARKATLARIEQLSEFDQLTGLPNRGLLERRFSQARDQSRLSGATITVAWLDLDNFKRINDSLGHVIGDAMLREVANRLRAGLGEEVTLSRQSGDDFLMILPGVRQEQAVPIATELLASLQQPFPMPDGELSVSGSLGLALYPADGETITELLAKAESAMYQVKQEGRNGFRFFSPEMQQYTARALSLASALRGAIDRQELRLVYQPQLCLRSNRIVGAEALLRWNSPQWGEISPAEFIPIAESGGLIVTIGEWVLRTASLQARRWREAGLTGMTMAVNLSAAQFARADLLSTLINAVTGSGASPDEIELELTEAIALKQPEVAMQTMHALRQAGFLLAIDDFGTGYSSMSYLKRFAVQKLKIDQSFVRDLGKDRNDQAIVTAIIQMAHSLGMTAIAEGVETSEQLSFLLAHGCDELQGYFFSKPRSDDDFLALALAQPTSLS